LTPASPCRGKKPSGIGEAIARRFAAAGAGAQIEILVTNIVIAKIDQACPWQSELPTRIRRSLDLLALDIFAIKPKTPADFASFRLWPKYENGLKVLGRQAHRNPACGVPVI